VPRRPEHPSARNLTVQKPLAIPRVAFFLSWHCNCSRALFVRRRDQPIRADLISDRHRSSEENYSEDVLRTFIEEERAQLRKLHQQLDDKFDEIASLLAEQLGFSTTGPRCYEKAENVIDRWEEDAEIAADPRSTAPASRYCRGDSGHS
jgi:hypothetical protein